MTKVEPIHAAGCVVYRRQEGRLEFLLVHRDRYDDWTFPKGKRDKGETDVACAKREVMEETGFSGPLGPELRPSHYVVPAKPKAIVRSPRPKTVRWWLMEYQNGEFTPNDEVDAIRWVTAPEAEMLLSYAHDRDLLREPDVESLTAA